MKTRFTALSVILLIAIGTWAMWSSEAGLRVRHAVGLQLKPYGMVTTLAIEGVGDVPLFVNPADKFITPWIWAGRVWEATETRWFVNSLRPGDVVVDIGANVGYYTVLAGRLVGDTGRVYAFEPDPVAFEILQKNVALSGLDNVVLEQRAVSNEPGSIRLYLAEENHGDHRIYQPEGEHREFVDVEAVSLDDYFAGVETSADFVKVDTQGAELAILKGMLEFIGRSPELVMAFEYSPRHLVGFGSTGKELLDVIETLDVEIFDVGMGGSDVNLVKSISRNELLRRFAPTRRFFTNLLLVRGRPDVIALLDAQEDNDA